MIETFQIIPAGSRGIWVFFVLIMLVFLGVTALLYATGRGSTKSRFEPGAIRPAAESSGSERFVERLRAIAPKE